MTRPALERVRVHLLALQTLLLLSSAEVSGQRMEQYCKIYELHTMCQTTGIGPACGAEVLHRGVSDGDASTIVRVHNHHRARVALGKEARGAPGPQPPAADMREMEWDAELALIAQRHADQCIFDHDCGDCRKVDRFSVGQNLYTKSQSNKVEATNWDDAVSAWYEEVQQVPKYVAPSYSFSPSTGHYTQVVWGSTYKIGCGYIMYKKGGWFTKLYTCNYGLAGNYIGVPMYQTGQSCSACPQGTSCSATYSGLCGSPGTSKVRPTSRRPLDSASSAATSCTYFILSLFFVTLIV